MNVIYGIEREVEHNNMVDFRNVEASGSQIRTNEKLLFSFTEFLQVVLSIVKGEVKMKKVLV